MAPFHAAAGACCSVVPTDPRDTVRFGVFSDVHYGRAVSGDRFCPEGRDRLAAALAHFARLGLPLALGLGDLLDNAAGDDDRACLAEVRDLLFAGPLPTELLMGNHDVANLDKNEFLAGGIRRMVPWHAFDLGVFRVCLLDGNCHPDGSDFAGGAFDWSQASVSPAQLAWLADELARHRRRPAIVCCHPELANPGEGLERDPHVVVNGRDVLRVLRQAGNVRAVFCGHFHPGRFQVTGGIPHVTLAALCAGPRRDPPTCAVITLSAAGDLTVAGHGGQASLRHRVSEACGAEQKEECPP
jgi:3',5'-cyclic AMP phosphodiesterase CpdA